MNLFRSCNFFAFLIFHAFLWADSPLSLDEAIRLGKNNNLSLKQQVERMHQADREMNIQKASFFPKLVANGSYSYTSELAKFQIPAVPSEITVNFKNQYDFNFSLQQTIFTGFRRSHLLKSAYANVESEKTKIQVAENQIILEIHYIYYAAQLNQLQQKVLRTSRERTQLNLETTINLYDAAQISAFDTLRVFNQLLSINTQLNHLYHQEKIILNQLAFLLNIQKPRPVKQFSGANTLLPLDPLNRYVNMALQNRPEIDHMNFQISALDYQNQSIGSTYFPQILAYANFHYARPGVNFFRDEWMDYYRLGISFQWELWNRGRRGNELKRAQHGLSILQLEKEKLMNQIESEVEEAYENLLTVKDQLELSSKLFAQEKEKYRIVSEKYKQGLATSLDLTGAQTDLTAAELQLQTNYIGWLKHMATLNYVTGKIQYH